MPNLKNQPQVVTNGDIAPPVPNAPVLDSSAGENIPNEQPIKKRKNNYLMIILLVILLIVIGVLVYYLKQNPINKVKPYIGNKTAENTPAPTSVPAPTPKPTIQPIVEGSVTYNVSQGTHKGPNIIQMIIDPQEPASGVAQNVSVKVRHSQPVTGVEIILKSDNTQKTYPLSLTAGTNLDGTWTGSWKIEDSILYTYMETIKATSADGISSVDVSIR